MALLLQRRTRIKTNTLTNPSLIHLFSTSNSNEDEPDSTTTDDHASTNSTSSFSSYFSDVKNVLKQRQPTSPSSTPGKPLTSSLPASGSLPQRSSQRSSLEEIRKNLSEYRRRSSDPNSTPFSPNQISLQELYKRNVVGKPGESMPNADLGPGKVGGRVSVEAIRESLRKIKPPGSAQSDRKSVDPMSLSALRRSWKLNPSDSTDSGTLSTVIGGTGTLPASVFGRKMREKEEGEISEEMKTEFVKPYWHKELGDKLRMLRPEAKGGDWFSLEELNQRLMKLRKMDEKATESVVKGLAFKDLRESLIQLKISDDDKEKKSSAQRFDILGELGRTPSFMLQPPQEHLVEKYFHEDNMSSEEKLKIKIAEVRDEFKMSESDCGSARVQVAQLTTKIQHLSKVLHKKDKHSRKGLVAMVQRRKRLLKYLRRTDWDSYCFVISKLNLRDNPDHSYKNRTNKSDGQTDKRAGRKGKKASQKGKRAGQTGKQVNHPAGLVS